MKKGIKRSIWHELQARGRFTRRFTMLWSSTAIKAFITVVEWTLLPEMCFFFDLHHQHSSTWTFALLDSMYGSLLSATLMSDIDDSLRIHRKNEQPSQRSYGKLQIKNGQVLALSLGFTFFLSNFLWAGRSRHIVKTGSSGLHSQAVEAKNPWHAYRGGAETGLRGQGRSIKRTAVRFEHCTRLSLLTHLWGRIRSRGLILMLNWLSCMWPETVCFLLLCFCGQQGV